jgi:hypothetical protein
MNLSEVIQTLKLGGLSLEIAEDGRLKVRGQKIKIEEYAPVIREHKTAILNALKLEGNYPLLDDRHACLECSNLTPQNSCREVVGYGKFVAWIDSQWLDKKHCCERFRVKAVRH